MSFVRFGLYYYNVDRVCSLALQQQNQADYGLKPKTRVEDNPV